MFLLYIQGTFYYLRNQYVGLQGKYLYLCFCIPALTRGGISRQSQKTDRPCYNTNHKTIRKIWLHNNQD